MTAAIDTLAAMRKLEKAGFKTEQAEALAEVMAHTGEGLATTGDIEGVRQELSVMRWLIGIHFAFTLAVVVPMALRVFGVL